MQWCGVSDEEINNNKVNLTFTFDTGLQRR